MSIKFNIITAMENDSTTAFVLEVPAEVAAKFDVINKDYITLEEVQSASEEIKPHQQVDWMKMIFDPTLAVENRIKKQLADEL